MSEKFPRMVFSARAQQYMAQMRSAEKAMQEHNRELLAKGWIFNPETGTWQNPNVPDVEIYA